RPEHLERILAAVGPAIVKIAPDIDDAMINEICDVCAKRARGMICTNTTTARPFRANETGGLSGVPLMEPSTSILAKVRQRVGPARGRGGAESGARSDRPAGRPRCTQRSGGRGVGDGVCGFR